MTLLANTRLGGGAPPVTLEQALSLREGDTIITPHSRIPRKPIRVTAVWVNTKRTIVLVRLASIDSQAWLHATGYELPPEGQVWDAGELRWVTKEYAAAKKAAGGRNWFQEVA